MKIGFAFNEVLALLLLATGSLTLAWGLLRRRGRYELWYCPGRVETGLGARFVRRPIGLAGGAICRLHHRHFGGRQRHGLPCHADLLSCRRRAVSDGACRALPPLDQRTLPLWGIPFAVKDNIDVAGLPTTAGCPAFAYRPARNATVVDRLLAAGAILIGKTNLDQFATGLVGVRSRRGGRAAGSIPQGQAGPGRARDLSPRRMADGQPFPSPGIRETGHRLPGVREPERQPEGGCRPRPTGSRGCPAWCAGRAARCCARAPGPVAPPWARWVGTRVP